MNEIKKKSIWHLAGALVVGLAIFSTACAVIEPANAPLPEAKIAPPVIPHSLEGRADCRLCHATGIAGAPQFPANHANRPSDVCITCHIKAPLAGSPPVAGIPDYSPGHGATTPIQSTSNTTETPAAPSAKDLFAKNCAACHGANRQGTPGLAPALTPETLAKLSDTQIRDAISNGRPGTAMPPFKASLSPEQITALLQLIKSPLP